MSEKNFIFSFSCSINDKVNIVNESSTLVENMCRLDIDWLISLVTHICVARGCGVNTC